MITGFVYKGGKNIWIDPEENSKQIYSTDPSLSKTIPEHYGNILDLFVEDKVLKVKTEVGIFKVYEQENS